MQDYSGAFEKASAAGIQTEAECGVSWNWSEGPGGPGQIGQRCPGKEVELDPSPLQGFKPEEP